MRKIVELLIIVLLVAIIAPGISYPQEEEATSDGSSDTPESSTAEQTGTGKTFFYIAAIKTVHGEKPESEFFDIGIRARLFNRLSSMGNFDIALSDTESENDTTAEPGSSSREFSDAGISLDYIAFTSPDSNREVFAGIKIKLFDAVPYWGFHLGSVEVCNSKLKGSFFTAGYIQRFFKTDSTYNATLDRNEHNHNFFIEFGLMSDRKEIPVICSLRIRAGILIPTPFWNHNPEPTASDVKSRIVIEIPIGKLIEH